IGQTQRDLAQVGDFPGFVDRFGDRLPGSVGRAGSPRHAKGQVALVVSSIGGRVGVTDLIASYGVGSGTSAEELIVTDLHLAADQFDGQKTVGNVARVLTKPFGKFHAGFVEILDGSLTTVMRLSVNLVGVGEGGRTPEVSTGDLAGSDSLVGNVP